MLGYPDNIQDTELNVEQFITPAKTWDVGELSQFLLTCFVEKMCVAPVWVTDKDDSFFWGVQV